MKIKDSKPNINLSVLVFKRPYTWTVLIVILSFSLINYIIGMTTGSSLSHTTVFLVNFIFILVMAVLAIGPGEAFDESYGNQRAINISDFKKVVVYTIIYIVFTIGFYKMSPVPPPIPKPQNVSIEVKYIQVYDTHDNNKDFYAIRYLDAKSKKLWNEVYKKQEDRIAVLNKIYDSDGKVKVKIFYKIADGKQFIEILDKPIEL